MEIRPVIIDPNPQNSHDTSTNYLYATSDVHPHFDDSDWPEGNEFPKTPPLLDINHPDITCGRGAFDAASKTETADVLAGSEIGFRVSYSASDDGPYGTFYHHGPGLIYLSKAPNDDLENYRGDGDWFKIAYAGPVSNNQWQLRGQPDVCLLRF